MFHQMLTTMNSASLKDLVSVIELMTSLSSQDSPTVSQQQTDLVRRLLCDDKVILTNKSVINLTIAICFYFLNKMF